MPDETIQSLQKDLHALRRRLDSTSTRAWDIITKLSIPMAMMALGWIWQVDRQVTTHTIRIQENARGILHAETRIDAMPPGWLRDIVNDLKRQNEDILQRLSSLEAQIKQSK